MNSGIKRYIFRVYGLIINSNGEVLISDEFQMNMRITKFPGGGMHYGEGTIDCLKREAVEELGQEVDIIEHFYTTDYFQKALFYVDAQLISIYYVAKLKEKVKFRIAVKPFDFVIEENGQQSFRWVKVANINPDDFTFPVDKKVVKLLKSYEGY